MNRTGQLVELRSATVQKIEYTYKYIQYINIHRLLADGTHTQE